MEQACGNFLLKGIEYREHKDARQFSYPFNAFTHGNLVLANNIISILICFISFHRLIIQPIQVYGPIPT